MTVQTEQQQYELKLGKEGFTTFGNCDLSRVRDVSHHHDDAKGRTFLRGVFNNGEKREFASIPSNVSGISTRLLVANNLLGVKFH